MKNTFLVSLIALVAVLTLVLAGSVIATNTLDVGTPDVYIDDLNPNEASIVAGETVAVDIYFTANENASEVEISAWLQGYRSKGDEKDFADLIDNKSYHGKLALKIPSDIDPEEDLDLYVRIESDAGNWEESYTLGVQRKSYKTGFLLVDAAKTVEAGSSVPIDIVVKNLGRHELEDLIVAVSIPELGIEKKAYFGDLTPTDDEDEYGEDAEDTAERRVYITIPANAEAKVYELVVEAFSDDVREIVKQNIAVVGTEKASNVLVPVTSKEMKVGDTETYNLIIVNSGNKLGVYEIIPQTTQGVIVTVKEPIVTVSAGSSKVVSVEVNALNEGTFSFNLDVNSDNQLVKKVTLNAVVGEKAITSNITVLTIVLAIVFVVLLIVLIVLLTRKPARTEELEESYY